MGEGPPPTDCLAQIAQPTLVATGSVPDGHASQLPPGFMDRAANAIATSIPRAERRVIDGAGHMVEANLVTPVLAQFLRD
ncbi:MAG: alpha/beta fold hydrolase [Actinomycetota bacterium]